MIGDYYYIMNDNVQQVILRPFSGLNTLLTLRRKPRTGDIQDMVERIDKINGYPGSMKRFLAGGELEAYQGSWL